MWHIEKKIQCVEYCSQSVVIEMTEIIIGSPIHTTLTHTHTHTHAHTHTYILFLTRNDTNTRTAFSILFFLKCLLLYEFFKSVNLRKMQSKRNGHGVEKRRRGNTWHSSHSITWSLHQRKNLWYLPLNAWRSSLYNISYSPKKVSDLNIFQVALLFPSR